MVYFYKAIVKVSFFAHSLNQDQNYEIASYWQND